MGTFVPLGIRTKTGAFWIIFILVFCCTAGTCKSQESIEANDSQTVTPLHDDSNKPQAIPEEQKGNLPLFTIHYARIQVPFEFTLWVLLASLTKIGFNIYQKLTIWIPESCLMIGIGLIVGSIMHLVKEEPPAVLSSNIFFLYMLPPIILENGYFMPTRPFFENVGTVLWYSVVGTLWNSVGIGLSLFAICQFEVFGVQDINMQENLLFASIISAVDPVATLNAFHEAGVNEQIYIVIFGEGLFNDAVTVVLYSMFAFMVDMPMVESVDVFLGVARFFVVGIGGTLFGFLFGFVAAFTSRFTNKVREIEPLFIFMFSYLAYLVAELFAISSVMAIITCAITMKYYVEENVSQGSCTTIRQVVKMLATISETLIFFFLGIVTITTDHEWNWAYIMFTLLFAFMWRGLGILVLTQIINPFRTIQFSLKDQFGLVYGGLRGAVCFALVFTLPESTNRRNLFVTASIAIIIFTVAVQGISIRPIVECINIRRTNKDLKTINVEIHSRTMEHVICGIEDLCGQWGHYYWKDKFKKFNDRILRRILLQDHRAESSIISLYKKLELQKAIELLDTSMGDISAVPSLVSLRDEKKDASRPEKKLLAADIKKMHNILSKNMYKIRHRTMAYTSKYNLPDDSPTRELLIRRHASVRRSLHAQSFREQPVENSSKSQKYYSLQPGGNLDSAFAIRRQSHVPMKGMNTVEGLRSPVEPPAASQHPGEGVSGSRGRKPPVPTPRRHRSYWEDEEENIISEDPEGGEEQKLPPPRWVPENSHPKENKAENLLLRHSSHRSQRSSTQKLKPRVSSP